MNADEAKFDRQREAMVDNQLRTRDIHDERVLRVMGEVPRERFLPPGRRGEAYGDYPLPIGDGQTISQPYIVALMTQELDVAPDHRVLDVGAGSGYQTAVLARLAGEVYAVERIASLAAGARAVLTVLGFDNVTVRVGDGTLGWAEHAPFDRILCGAAAPEVPPAWVEQLADGGRIVLPTGGADVQRLIVVAKHGRRTTRRDVCGVRFVRLIGEQGWPE
jgi:protein-L-isoaspartate(D-aspartate) O-methyltransferase